MSLASIGSFLIFIVVLSGLIFVHEFGHFLAAKRLGVHIEEFGFGFPPRLFGVVRDATGKLRIVKGMKSPSVAELGGPRTIYSINAIPVGGFVRPAGEDDPLAPGGLAGASKRVRFAVLMAGPVFNLVFAFFVFVLGFMLGWPEAVPNRVEIVSVIAGAPADAAGLREGDIVVKMDAETIESTDEASAYIHSHLGQAVRVTIERAGQVQQLTVTPRSVFPDGQGPTGIVLGTPYTVVHYSLPQASARAAEELGTQFRLLFELPGRILRREVPLETVRPIGVVGLNDLTREAVSTAREINQWFPVLQLIGLVSVALATTNLLPLPALDGGRILFVLIEAVRGRRVDPTREGMVHLVGMIMLLLLMVIITYQDIFNPIVPR
jgi:regulator of sigma E protease